MIAGALPDRGGKSLMGTDLSMGNGPPFVASEIPPRVAKR
jgi:hypothetical protein